MKTAMQLALARIEMLYIEKDSIHWEMFKNDCMEKEKEQIKNAFFMGRDEVTKKFLNSSEEYYNGTYNQNK